MALPELRWHVPPPAEARHSLGAVYGTILRSAEMGGLILTEHRYDGRLRMPAHSHDHSHLYYVLEGGCVDTYAREEACCGPATLVFHPAGARHAVTYGEHGAHTFGVEIQYKWLEQVDGSAGPWGRSAVFRGSPPSWVGGRLYREFCLPDAVTPLVIEALMLELLAQGIRETGGERRTPAWLQLARERLAADPAEPFSLGRLAQAVGVHPSHLAREFRRAFRCTPGDYVRSLRLDQACRQLTTSDASLADIALSVGFSDQSHFCRSFKHQTGLTPREFRNRHRRR
jgi:AraC family transcriptional regulator